MISFLFFLAFDLSIYHKEGTVQKASLYKALSYNNTTHKTNTKHNHNHNTKKIKHTQKNVNRNVCRQRGEKKYDCQNSEY